MVRGHTKIPGGEHHRHETGFGKETMRFGISIIFWFIWHGHQQMHRRTMAVLLHMCSGFPTKLMEQMIVMSLDDVRRFSHAIEGSIKGEHN